MNETVRGLVLPAVPVTCSHEHSQWRGTVSIRPILALQYVDGIVNALFAGGFDRVVITSGHGGNYFLSNIAQSANSQEPRVLVFPTRRAQEQVYKDANLVTTPHDDMHAGEYELSLGLHLGFAMREPSELGDGHSADERELLTLFGMGRYTPSGVIGQPQLASAPKGRDILESYARSFQHIWELWSSR